MSLGIAGMGWVTPLGGGLTEVWDQLRRGATPPAETLAAGASQPAYQVFRVPPAALQGLPAHPRLRRASAISRFAAAAGLNALADAQLTVTPENNARIALIFAISNGGVIYTRRFYHDIVATGAEAASPLLFPETVFNAAASHLAAILGITGTSYTVVGDGAVGLLAVRLAEDLMAEGRFDYCLVVGAEEADWLLCDAYAKWRLLRRNGGITPFERPARGMILSEGAGAIVVSRDAPVKLVRTHPGTYFASRAKVSAAVEKVLSELEPPAGSIIIASANGTFIDQAEADAMAKLAPASPVCPLKSWLGESVGAAGLWQIIAGAMILRSGQIPPLSPAGGKSAGQAGPKAEPARRVVALAAGLNQQAGGALLSL